MKKKSLVICAITASTFLLTACATVPPNAFMVTPEILQQRQLESHRYDSIKEADLLTASANVLQDLGYNLENSESRLGILTASKQRNAVNPGEVAAALVVALLGGGIMPISQDQIIRVALIVRPSYDGEGKAMLDSHQVRVTFQRVVRRTDGSMIAETLNDPQLYEGFFDKLSKSVFLEAHKV